jgi:hypothetical protein
MGAVKSTVLAGASSIRERERKIVASPFAPAKGIEALGSSAIFMAAGLAVAYFAHAAGLSVRMILPLHFPALLAGLTLSPVYALMVGVLTPALSYGLTGFPTMSQVMRMVPELAAYGFITSLMLKILPIVPGLREWLGRLTAMMLAMFAAMVTGRLVYIVLYVAASGPETIGYFTMILLAPAWPGIIAQLVLLPPLAGKFLRIANRA